MLMRRVNSSRNCSYSGVVVVSAAFAIIGSLVPRPRAAGRALPRTGAGPAGIVLFPDSIVRHASSRWDRRSVLVPIRRRRARGRTHMQHHLIRALALAALAAAAFASTAAAERVRGGKAGAVAWTCTPM